MDTFFAMLADATRRRILALLVERPSLCVCEIVQALNLAQPRTSSHLAALRKAGLVRGRRKGLWVHYALANDMPAWQHTIIEALHDGMRETEQFRADLARLNAQTGPEAETDSAAGTCSDAA